MKAEFICVNLRILWTSSTSLLFRRWHLSSRLVVVFLILLLVGINLPGNVVKHVDQLHEDDEFAPYALVPQYEHGWPMTHVVRQEVKSSSLRLQRPKFLAPTITRCWQFWDITDRDEFHPWRLAGNVAIGICISTLGGCMFELWRRRHRSWLQIHIFDVGLAMTAVAAVLGWYVAARNVHTREETLLAAKVDEMTESGRIGNDMFSVEWEQRGPTWMRLWLGDEYFQFLDRVVAAESQREEGRAKLAEFRELRRGDVTHRHFTEVDQLRQMPNLEELDLTLRIRTDPATGQEIRLPNLPNLRVLTIRSIENRATGLNQFQNLRILRVHNSFLSSESLQEISQLRNLRRLSLDYSYFPAEALQHLRLLSRLEDLDLDKTTLKDEPLTWLSELSTLKRLSVQESNLTATAIGNIAHCKRLEVLAVDHLSEDGLRTLLSMPRLRVIYVSTPDKKELTIPKNHFGWKIDGDALNGHWLVTRDVSSP